MFSFCWHHPKCVYSIICLLLRNCIMLKRSFGIGAKWNCLSLQLNYQILINQPSFLFSIKDFLSRCEMVTNLSQWSGFSMVSLLYTCMGSVFVFFLLVIVLLYFGVSHLLHTKLNKCLAAVCFILCICLPKWSKLWHNIGEI